MLTFHYKTVTKKFLSFIFIELSKSAYLACYFKLTFFKAYTINLNIS